MRRPRERHPEGRGYLQGRARPAVPVNVEFGREHACDREDRDLRWGVETICAVLTEHWLNRPVQVLRAPVEGADRPPAAGRDLVEHLPGARRELLGVRRPKSVADPKPSGRRRGSMYGGTAMRIGARPVGNTGAQTRIQSMRTGVPAPPQRHLGLGRRSARQGTRQCSSACAQLQSGIGIPRQNVAWEIARRVLSRIAGWHPLSSIAPVAKSVPTRNSTPATVERGCCCCEPVRTRLVARPR